MKKILCLFLTVSTLLFAQSKNGTIEIQRLDGDIRLDGIVDEESWKKIEPLPLVTHWPEFGNKPTDHTEIRITYDEKYIYVSGIMTAKPEHILAASFKRDIWTLGTDYLTLILDTYNDNENALVFSTTPTGSRTDVAVSDDANNVDPSWNTFWECEASYDEKGWTAEMRIPFASMGFQVQDGIVEMGLAVMRLTARKNEMFVFPAMKPNWGFWSWLKPSKLQKVVFKNIKSHNPLYITPYVLAGHGMENELNDSETRYKKKNDFTKNLGLDIRYNVTDNLTLDFSFNTDFAQVEADDQQVNLTRFNLFFPEKRRFFLERASIFDFSFSGSNRLFYTRRIGLKNKESVDIMGGARLTGRIGEWDIGLLNVQTGGEKGLLAENFGVVRLKKQVFNTHSYLGGMVTNRVNDNYHYNLAVGLDGLFNIFENDFLSFSFVQTYTDTINNSIDFANSSRARLKWERRSYTGFAYNFSAETAGKNYTPGMGFEYRDNFSHLNSQLSFGWAEKGQSDLQRHRFALNTDVYTRNEDNSIETIQINPFWEGTLLTGAFIERGITISHEKLEESFNLDNATVEAGEYTFASFYTYLNTPGGREFRSEEFFKIGSYFDGTIFSFGVKPTWITSKYLELSVNYEYNYINFSERDQLFTSHITQLKSLLTLNTQISLSAFLQYNSNADIISTNARFRYNPSEGHDLYIVYNEFYNADRKRYDPVRPLTKNRTILAKYTYTFTF